MSFWWFGTNGFILNLGTSSPFHPECALLVAYSSSLCALAYSQIFFRRELINSCLYSYTVATYVTAFSGSKRLVSNAMYMYMYALQAQTLSTAIYGRVRYTAKQVWQKDALACIVSMHVYMYVDVHAQHLHGMGSDNYSLCMCTRLY